MSPEPSDIPQGYLPPDDAYRQAMRFTLENDPLVNDSQGGISGWFSKIIALLSRSGKTLLPLFAVTMFAPTVVVSFLSGAGGLALTNLDSRLAPPPAELFAGAAVIAVFLGFIGTVLQMMGFAGATYIATREAAGMSVRWTEGMRYGLRRGMGLLGWYILTALAVGIPLILIISCLFSAASFLAIVVAVPLVVFAALATAMVGPAYLFERGNALGRSFRLFRGAAARMTGRLLLVGLVYLVVSGAEQMLALIPPALIPTAMPQSPLQYGAQFAVALLTSGVQALGLMIVFAGILVTYAERRGDEGSLTPDLVDQL